MVDVIKIIHNKIKNKSMGESLNCIQDVAEKVLDKRRWRQYLIASSNDANECDGMDGLLLNGEYFDWKVFEVKKDNMIDAYLRYFTESEVKRIGANL